MRLSCGCGKKTPSSTARIRGQQSAATLWMRTACAGAGGYSGGASCAGASAGTSPINSLKVMSKFVRAPGWGSCLQTKHGPAILLKAAWVLMMQRAWTPCPQGQNHNSYCRNPAKGSKQMLHLASSMGRQSPHCVTQAYTTRLGCKFQSNFS